jgi:high-affinity Fe2+/Pb2+ permease
MKTELPAPAKHRRWWPWVLGYVVALALLAFFGVTVDQTGNNENGVWAAFFAVLAVGGVFVWRMTFRKG